MRAVTSTEELMPVIRREGLVGVVIHTTMEQLSNLRLAVKLVEDGELPASRILAEIPEWVEAMDRFTDSGWESS